MVFTSSKDTFALYTVVLIATYSSSIASMLLSISSSLIPIYGRVMEGDEWPNMCWRIATSWCVW